MGKNVVMLPVRQQIGGLGNLMFKQAYILGQFLDGKIPDVYLQSTKYWETHKEEIKATFSEGIGNDDRIGIQIRRGDYVNNSFYVDLTDTDYYEKAIVMFPGERFLIFCADRQGRDGKDRVWVKNWAKSLNCDFWCSESETDDLNKLASCKGRIIANSSFGWWAGFLGNGTTVAPKAWFTDEVQRVDLPDNFVQI